MSDSWAVCLPRDGVPSAAVGWITISRGDRMSSGVTPVLKSTE